MAQHRPPDPVRTCIPKFSGSTRNSKAYLRKQRSLSTLERSNFGSAAWRPIVRDRMSLHEGSSVLDLKGENYFSCAVSRKRSNARYLLRSSNDVVTLLKELAESSSSSWLQFYFAWEPSRGWKVKDEDCVAVERCLYVHTLASSNMFYVHISIFQRPFYQKINFFPLQFLPFW